MKTLSLGKLLDRRYRVISNLAAGGFGQTYIAQDTRRPGHPKCVVKLLQPASNNPKFLENARRLFATEAETLEQLGSHDQIPRLLANFEEGKDFYLVQELIEGHPLIQELRPGQIWTEDKVFQMLQEVLNVLVFVHGHRVIHRDIKPENLIRRHRDNKLVLVDFGTVKQIRTQMAVQGLTTSTIALGTPGYMPTEQSHGKPRPNSDIYALGMIGIQAVTGRDPLQMQDDPETGEIIWHSQAQISPQLTQLLTQMVRYHFRDRYQSALEVLQDLATWIGDARILPSNNVIALEAPTNEPVVQPPYEPHPTVIAPHFSAGFEATPSYKPLPTVMALGQVLSESSFSSVESTEALEVAKPIREPEIELPEIKLPEIKLIEAIAPVESVTAVTNEVISDRSDAESLAPETVKPSPNLLNVLSHRWFKVGSVAFVLLGVVAGGFYWNQWQAVSRTETALKQVEVLKGRGKFEECVEQIQRIQTPFSPLKKRADLLLGECWLGQANILANNRRFKDAINKVSNISLQMPTYAQAQKLINQWTGNILQTATAQYRQGNFAEASALVKAIPASSPGTLKVQKVLQQWQTEWQQNESLLKAATEILRKKQWQQAIDKAKQVKLLGKVIQPTAPYWKQKVQPIIAKAEQGKESERLIAEQTADTTAKQLTEPARSFENSEPVYAPAPAYGGNSNDSYSAPSYQPEPRNVAPPPPEPPSGGEGAAYDKPL